MHAFSYRYDPTTDKIGMSYCSFKTTSLGFLGQCFVRVFGSLGLCEVRDNMGENGEYTECSNMTLIVLLLKITGPMHERNLTILILIIQVGNDPH